MVLTRRWKPVLTLMLALAISASAAQARGATEHGVIQPMPGATLADALSTTVDFSSYEFRVKQVTKR